MSEYPTISRITLPSGSTYDIKDEEARQRIEDLTTIFSGAVHYKGQTSTELFDGSPQNPIIINEENYYAKPGDLVIYGDTGLNSEAPKEFIYNGTLWNEFGSTGSLKALAFQDNVSAEYTPHGYVSTPNFEGEPATIESTYIPSGEVTIPNFTGIEATLIVTPAAGETTYTPSGVISNPTISVTLNTDTLNSIQEVGSLPELNMSVENQVLTVELNPGTLPTYLTKTFATNVKSATAATPEFIGTGVHLISNYVPEGNISQPSFIGYQGTATGEYTPAGSIGDIYFDGVEDTIISS